jgi:hypothetical protein
MNKPKITPLLKAAAIITLIPLLCAWVAPVNLNEDLAGSENCADGITTNALCNSLTLSNTEKVDRCDTAFTGYVPPSTCHRWNLIWDAVTTGVVGSEVLTQQTDWIPSLSDNDWRLPTIKELTRLINFGLKSNETLVESTSIKNWFINDANWPSAGIDDDSKAVWLISSTFRDIDINEGDDVADAPGQAQIFAINIISGEIKTFEPGTAGVDDDGLAITELKLCVSLKGDGTCNYPLDAVPENIIFSLKVRTQTVQDLI